MQALKCGDKWVETDRLYTKWNGLPMQNGTPYFWLGEFCEKHDLPFYGLHSFRHLFASLLVNQGVDKNRDGKMTVILDEVQTLNHRKDSILVHILSRVRKLDISVILASQNFLNSSLSTVYKYCGTHILFRPLGEECIKAVAELTKLDINTIRALPDFHCAIMGTAYSEYYQKNIQLHSAIIGETYRPLIWGITRKSSRKRLLGKSSFCIVFDSFGHNLNERGADVLEIYDKRDKGYIEVWMTNEEQQMYDCAELTHLLLKDTNPKKCKVVFFLSGKEDLCANTEKLLIANLGCA